MTNQDAFDIAVWGVIWQGCQSVVGPTCKLRGGGGMKCAIGHLIPDEEYRPVMDSWSANAPAEYVAERETVSASLLIDLRIAHDCSSSGELFRDFVTHAVDIASRYGLHFDPPVTP